MESAGRLDFFFFFLVFVCVERQDYLICVSLNPIETIIAEKKKKTGQSISWSSRKGMGKKATNWFLTKHGTREKRAFATSSKGL